MGKKDEEFQGHTKAFFYADPVEAYWAGYQEALEKADDVIPRIKRGLFYFSGTLYVALGFSLGSWSLARMFSCYLLGLMLFIVGSLQERG